MQTTTAYDAILKEDYQGPIRDELNENTNLVKHFTKTDATNYPWEGRVMIVPLHHGRNVGVKATAEGGLVPAAGAQAHDKLQIPMTFWESRIQLTIQVMKASRTSKGAFAQAMEVEKSRLVNDVSRQRNRALAGAGYGILAIVSSTNAPAIVLKNPGGVTGTTNPVRYILPGMVVAFHVGSTSALRGVATVVSIDSASQITLDAMPVGTVANDAVTIGASAGGVTEGSYAIEAMGILGLVDSTTYVSSIFGIDRSLAANAYFRSLVSTSTGSLTRDLLFRFTDNAEEIGGVYIDKFLCHQSVRREYLKLQEGDARWPSAVGNLNPDIGSPAQKNDAPPRFSGSEIFTDKDFAYGTLVGYSSKNAFRAVETEGEWCDEDGGILLRSPTSDAYEGRYRLFEQFFFDRGNGSFRLDGLNATVTSGVYAL